MVKIEKDTEPKPFILSSFVRLEDTILLEFQVTSWGHFWSFRGRSIQVISGQIEIFGLLFIILLGHFELALKKYSDHWF